jgi:hypothetical protein
MGSPEVGAAGEDEAVEMVGGTHGLDDHVGEGAGAESLRLNVATQRREVAIHRPELRRGDRHLVRPRRSGRGQGRRLCGPLRRRHRRVRLWRGGHRRGPG